MMPGQRVRANMAMSATGIHNFRFSFTPGMIRCGGAMTSRRLFKVIDEDDDLLVVNKPADLVCHPTKGDVYSSLISQVRLHLGSGALPQLINRLDRETSGLVLVGKHSGATLQARRAWESRAVSKEYWAIVHGWISSD